CPYTFDKARMVAWEMADQLALELVSQGLVTDQLTLTVGYDIDNLRDADRRKRYHGEVKTDRYGRQIPKHAHGTANLEGRTASSKRITAAILELYDRIVDKDLLIRRMNLTANQVTDESAVSDESAMVQMDLFTDYADAQAKKEAEAAELARERKLQEAMLGIKNKFGKNAILKGTNLIDGATAADRNSRIGGHKKS
ncbi:DinB/UmuC family translesion DNA polymerase, partial [Acutalibacter muris]|uniref:DinB/UmuC family translesion DNA polymerase n=1 Tax=Acutalibacter muris TaxID=1796620 RepID=UPI003FA48317